MPKRVGNFGMFINNFGTIQDLKVKDAKLYIQKKEYDQWTSVGILTNTNLNDAIIERCSISGEIIGTISNNCNLGGIAGIMCGVLRNSYSDVDMSIFANEKKVRVGTIVGNCGGGIATIKNVYSKGNIYQSNDGVVALAIGVVNVGNITNSYTIAKAKVEPSDEGGIQLGTFCQYDQNNGVLNCYYLANSIEIIGDRSLLRENRKIGTEKTEEFMKSKDMIDLLNTDEEEPAWKQDTNNINDGYPILSWQ